MTPAPAAVALAAVLALAALAAAPLLTGCERSTAPVPLQWKLAWSDEFDGPAGQSPSPGNWTFDIGTNWGNNQLEYDTARPENCSLDGAGNLAIVARKETYLRQNYTSARIKTLGHFAQARGRFEARIKLPVGQGIWPAFWMLGENYPTVGWPDCGEIDIMEYRGQEPRVVLGSLHGPGYSGANSITGTYTLPVGAFNDDFHVFSIEWDIDRITFMVDGDPYRTMTPRDLPSGSRWVFDHPFFILLNVAVGGNFVGPPNASTTFPQTMLVDWVRVYTAEP
jgi:beta-glucanase (GH16 family)